MWSLGEENDESEQRCTPKKEYYESRQLQVSNGFEYAVQQIKMILKCPSRDGYEVFEMLRR